MPEPAPKERENFCILILKFIAFYWRPIFLLLWPLICLSVLFIGTDEKIRCLFVVMLMAGYWVTECIPLYVTGLLPVVLMPLLSIMNTGDVCKNYFNTTNMMLLASLFLASTIEHCGLHNRIALGTIKMVGCSPRVLHFGLTMVTMFLSMWLINAATTAMMCPVIHAVLAELEAQGIGNVYVPPDPNAKDDEPPRPTKITMAYFFAVAYASTIGGTACLVGTGTNLTFKGLYETRFPDLHIDFVDWLGFNFPGAVAMTVLMWFSLQVQHMGMLRKNTPEYLLVQQGKEKKEAAYNVIQGKLKELGPMTWHEIGVAILFCCTILLWFFRKPQMFTGWGDLYKHVKISDATPAILIVALMVAVPATLSFVYYCSKDTTKRPVKPSPGLVTWKILQEKMPWGLLFLLGGGFALADAGKKSGMSTFLGKKLSGMSHLNSYLVLGITSFLSSLATELTSNVAICNILVPVLFEMSVAMKIHPIFFGYPAAVNCSFAFLLPVGTPANAIIVDQANIRTSDMIKTGFFTKLITWALVFLLFPTYGRVFYDMNGPISSANSTTV